MQRVLAHAAAAALLAACLAPAAFAQAPGPQPHDQNGITYLNGGVGSEEQTMMRSVRADYNLQLTFATNSSGAYRSDVQVDIVDAKGNVLVSRPNAGPMFFAKLPAGTYRLTAAAEGKTFKRTIKAGSGVKEMTLHWDGDSQDDPDAQQ